MGAKILGLGTLFVIGLMLADSLTHPKGTATLASGSENLLKIGGNQLLGNKVTGTY